MTVDTQFLLKKTLFPNIKQPPSNVAVIAIDEETYKTQPFDALPKVMWTPQFADVMYSLLRSEAKVIGYDVVLPTTVEKAQGVGDKLRGYDKEFRKSLFIAARQNKVVLGKVQHKVAPISPERGYSFAVGHEKNIRLLNVGSRGATTADSVIREVPLWFDEKGGGKVTSFAVELASRALGQPFRLNEDAQPQLGDYIIPQPHTGSALINFDTTDDAIPTYSFADMHHCIQQGKLDYFKKHFKDKVVIIGAVLDIEDRKLTSMRYATPLEGKTVPERCTIDYEPEKYAATHKRDTIPGVYVHAQAINNLMNRNFLERTSALLEKLWLIPLVLAVTLVSLFMSPTRAMLFSSILALIWLAISTTAFSQNYVIPLYNPILAAAIAFLSIIIFRYTVLDKDKRVLKKVFSYYLESAIIDKMVEQGQAPVLGGETRDLTVWFSDIANYTAISETMEPKRVVKFLNTYFSAMSEIVKQHGGFVDKYIGDAIIAVFGTPLEDPNHAINALRSVMACRDRLEGMMNEFDLPNDIHIYTRFGINSGDMLVGNIGSMNRLNYTVIGDEVNLASRLEAINKRYNSTIMVSESTKQACESEILFREIDAVRVKGKTRAVSIYEPICERAKASVSQIEQVAQFESALKLFREKQFEEAHQRYLALAEDGDLVAEVFVEFCQHYATNPPAHDWDGIATMTSK